jgi:predicted phosphoribosyltransferase
LTGEGAHVEVITTPSSFGSVGQFYDNFNQVTDEEVKEVARKWGLLE